MEFPRVTTGSIKCQKRGGGVETMWGEGRGAEGKLVEKKLSERSKKRAETKAKDRESDREKQWWKGEGGEKIVRGGKGKGQKSWQKKRLLGIIFDFFVFVISNIFKIFSDNTAPPLPTTPSYDSMCFKMSSLVYAYLLMHFE